MTNQHHSSQPAAEGRRRFVADVAALTFAGYLVQPVMFASNLFTRRSLGPWLAGVFATLMLVQQYTQLLNLGVLQAAERQLPFLRGRNDPDRHARIKVASLTVALASGLITAVGTLAYALVRRSTIDSALYQGLVVYAGLGLFTQWSLSILTFLRSEQRFQYLARNNVLFMVLTAIGNVTLTHWFGFAGLLGWTAFTTILGCVAYTRAFGLVRPRVDRSILEESKKLVVAGIPLLLVNFSHMGVHTMDNVMVLKLLGTEELGKYTLALSGGAVIYSFANSVTQVLYPRIQEEHGRAGNNDVVLRLIGRPTMILAVILPVFVAPLFFLLPVIVRAYIPKFIGGLPAFRIIMAGISLYALIQIPRLCLISLGRMRLLIIWSLVTMATCVGAAYGLVGFGLPGVAIAACIAYLIGFVGPTAHLLKDRPRGAPLIGPIVRAIVPGGYAAAILWGIEHYWPTDQSSPRNALIHALLRMGLFLCFYAPLMALSESETGLRRDYLAPAWRRVAGRSRGKNEGFDQNPSGPAGR